LELDDFSDAKIVTLSFYTNSNIGKNFSRSIRITINIIIVIRLTIHLSGSTLFANFTK